MEGRPVVVAWVVGFFVFFRQPGLEGALAWEMLGEVDGEQRPPRILHRTLVHSHPMEMWLLLQVKGLFKATSATGERLFCNVMLVWRGPFNLRTATPPSASKPGLHFRKSLS